MGQHVMRLRVLLILGAASLAAGCVTETPVADGPGPGMKGTSASSSGGGTGSSVMPAMNPEQAQRSTAMTQGYAKSYGDAAAARQQQTGRR